MSIDYCFHLGTGALFDPRSGDRVPWIAREHRPAGATLREGLFIILYIFIFLRNAIRHLGC